MLVSDVPVEDPVELPIVEPVEPPVVEPVLPDPEVVCASAAVQNSSGTAAAII